MINITKKEKDKRSKKVQVGLTFWENLIITWRSEKLGLTKSAYVRQKALSKETDLSNLKELLIAIDRKLSNLSLVQTLKAPAGISLDKLKPPSLPKIPTKETISMKECIQEMRTLFERGSILLNKIPDEEIEKEEIVEIHGKKISLPSKKERIGKYLKIAKETEEES